MFTDPGQYKDIARQKPQVAKRLRDAQKKFQDEVVAGYDVDNRPFVIGHPDYKYTQIPARDGTAHGNIKRSNKFPNCSFFTNWVSVDDKITWTAEVGASGNYQVDLEYACPKKDLGSTIELSFNDARLRTKITQAHNPPLRGHENDRVQRVESYVKDFKSVRIGTIDLEKGSGELTLKALSIPGAQALEFRLLMLTRIK